MVSLPLSLALTGALVAGPPAPTAAPSFFERDGALTTTVGLAVTGVGAVLGAGGLVGSLIHRADSERLQALAEAYVRSPTDDAGADVVNLRTALGQARDRVVLERTELVVGVVGGVLVVAGWVTAFVGARELVDDGES
jgi:hypothetical protein